MPLEAASINKVLFLHSYFLRGCIAQFNVWTYILQIKEWLLYFKNMIIILSVDLNFTRNTERLKIREAWFIRKKVFRNFFVSQKNINIIHCFNFYHLRWSYKLKKTLYFLHRVFTHIYYLTLDQLLPLLLLSCKKSYF